MATQGYGTSPSRNKDNSQGTSLPRSVTTKPVPIVTTEMKKAPTKGAAK